MNDLKIKEVLVNFDKERHLRYDLNAFAEIEDNIGTLEEAMNKIQQGSVKAIRTLLWAGLVWEDSTLTEQTVGSWLGLNNMGDIASKITEAITGSLPEDDGSNPPASGSTPTTTTPTSGKP